MLGYVYDIRVATLVSYNSPVIGMASSSDTQGYPVSGGQSYGVFAFLPASYNGNNRFCITLFDLFDSDYSLNFTRFFIRAAWGDEGVWKEISLT